MDSKEKWLNEVENSLQGLKPVEANRYLYFKIMNRLEKGQKEITSTGFVWLTAVSFILLLLINFTALKTLTGHKGSEAGELQSLSKQYQLMNTNTINYN